MTQAAITLAYRRTSPIHIPRRDMVVSSADSVWLAVSIVESDHHNAQLLLLTGGVGGPALRMTIWPDDHGYIWDYGWLMRNCRHAIWSGFGAISTGNAGTFNIAIPLGTLACVPHRCRYAMQLDWSGGERSEAMCWGILHIRHAASATPAEVVLLTDNGVPILT